MLLLRPQCGIGFRFTDLHLALQYVDELICVVVEDMFEAGPVTMKDRHPTLDHLNAIGAKHGMQYQTWPDIGPDTEPDTEPDTGPIPDSIPVRDRTQYRP
ncbi:hypothetical protein AB0G35_04960 [Streptomyces sp. NPDC021749]|uniref:hypothetical protein n=1 Tax=Streptomyces sp. NPDC021749 TaxID=3154905 RepID=UPI0033D96700